MSPQEVTGDMGVTPRGDTGDVLGVTLVSPKEIQGNLQLNSQDERERLDGVMQDLRATYPRRALGWSDPAVALSALAALLADGVEIEELPGCAARMAVDPVIKRRDFGPPRLEAWLSKRQFEGWWPEPEAAPAAASRSDGRFDGPPEIRASVVAEFGETQAQMYLDRSAWDEAGEAIIAWSGTAYRWMTGEARAVFHGRWAVVERNGGTG